MLTSWRFLCILNLTIIYLKKNQKNILLLCYEKINLCPSHNYLIEKKLISHPTNDPNMSLKDLRRVLQKTIYCLCPLYEFWFYKLFLLYVLYGDILLCEFLLGKIVYWLSSFFFMTASLSQSYLQFGLFCRIAFKGAILLLDQKLLQPQLKKWENKTIDMWF